MFLESGILSFRWSVRCLHRCSTFYYFGSSTIGPSASQVHIRAITAQPILEDEEGDWPWYPGDDWIDPDWTDGSDWQEDWSGDFYADESPSYEDAWDCAEDSLVCAIRATDPSTLGGKVLIDSGSQSIATMPSFASGYPIDDTHRANLWDVKEDRIIAYGKRVAVLSFLGSEVDMSGKVAVDVAEVGQNLFSLGRMCRSAFDFHFTEYGHRSWMERNGQISLLEESDYDTEAPLFYARVEAQPLMLQDGNPTDSTSLLVAPVQQTGLYAGCVVKLAGLES